MSTQISIGFQSDEALLGHLVTCIQNSPFTGVDYRKVWARLRFEGIRTSPLRTLQIMRENNLLAVRNPGRPHGPKAHDGTIKTARVDEMWGTDMTTTMTMQKGNASVFLAVNHRSLECVGTHAAKYVTRLKPWSRFPRCAPQLWSLWTRRGRGPDPAT